MHRQSLGSPLSKLQHHGGVLVGSSKHDALPSLSPSQQQPAVSSPHSDDEHNQKSSKPVPRRFSLSPPRSLVHLIPLLTFLCFLVLFLVSHTPSQSELAQFKGFNWPSTNHIDSLEIDRETRFAELRRGEVLSIRSLSSFSGINGEDRAFRKYRSHRKFADF